jgi:hypothetical protein
MTRAQKHLLGALLFAFAAFGAGRVQAQQSLAAAQTAIATSELIETVLDEITTVEDKLVAAAEHFPEKLFSTYRLNGKKDSASPAELFLQVADFNDTSAFQMSTKEQQRAGRKPDDRDYDYVSKADTVIKVRHAFASVRQAIQTNPDPKNLQDWLFVISWSNQAYGRLWIYYQLNGLQPPAH